MSEPQPKQTLNQKRIAEFMTNLNRLDMGSRARLKRSAGKSLREARSTIGIFYALLPHPTPPSAEESIYWLIATHFPLLEGTDRGNLGAALRRIRTSENEKGLNRRFEALLDADYTQLAYRLGQTIRLLHANKEKLNWVGLLTDLLHWEHPERFVQKAWAKSYFALSPKTVEQLIQTEVEKLTQEENK